MMESDPQPSDSKSDALSIGPHGLELSYHCKYTINVPKCFRNTVKTVRTMDSNGPRLTIRLSCVVTICTIQE